MWTYDPGNVAAQPLMQVRFLIGDVIAGDPQMQDEEIVFTLSQRSSIYGAAAMCCRSLAAQMSRKADTVQGDLHTMYSNRARAYATRAAEYEMQSTARGGALPYAGGISIADKQRQQQDTDRVPPQFNLGMEDNRLPVGPVGNETLEPGSGG